MAGARFVEDLLARGGGDRFDIVVFGDEPRGNYNRILLSSVLAAQPQARRHLHQSAVVVRGATASRFTPASASNGSTCSAKQVSRRRRARRAVRHARHRDRQQPRASRRSTACARRARRASRRACSSSARSTTASASCARAATARRAAVIGGGLLGLEAARGLLNRGLETHVVHLMPHLMDTQLDPARGRCPPAAARADGPARRTLPRGRRPFSATATSPGLAFADGSPLECDLVVVAAGIRPNVEARRRRRPRRSTAASSSATIWRVLRAMRRRTSTPSASAPSTAAACTGSSRRCGSRRRASPIG